MGIQKALVATVTSVVALVAAFGFQVPEATLGNAEWVSAAAMVLTPILVWAVPNRK